MCWFILEAALVNAWVVYSQSMKEAQKELQYTHFEFRIAIAKALVGDWETYQATSSKPQSMATTSPLHHFKVSKKAKLHLILNSGTSDRFSCPSKHSQHRVKIPITAHGKTKYQQLQCQFCDIGRAAQMCKACVVPLCIPDCYLNYHTQEPRHHVFVERDRKENAAGKKLDMSINWITPLN